jgi:hypothetical protein
LVVILFELEDGEVKSEAPKKRGLLTHLGEQDRVFSMDTPLPAAMIETERARAAEKEQIHAIHHAFTLVGAGDRAGPVVFGDER